MGCAAILGASIAFPIGLLVGGGGNAPQQAARSSGPLPSGREAPPARNHYSPRIAGDPYVVEEQRKVLRALELSCARMKQHCAEAEQARRRIAEAEAR